MFLTADPILAKNFLETAGDFRAGAEVLFLGVVRSHSGVQKVICLEYEAYEMMAEKMIEELVREAFARWSLEEIKITHRIGRVELGQIAVAIQVNSAHRDEAYQASRFLIEEIKHRVPIWKKEYFEDGTSRWGSCASRMSVAEEGVLKPC